MTAVPSPIRQAVGIDVGGTKTAAARVDRDGAVLALETLATPADDVDATLATIVEAARAVITPDVGAVGIAAAGLVEWGTGELAFAPNLAWRNVSLSRYLESELGLPAVADNDNTAAAWGEYLFGAGRGFADLLLVGVGTGIGGGIVTGREAVPRRARVRGGDRSHRDGSRRPAVRVREPRVLGAVGVRSGRGPGGARGDRRATPTRR